MPLLARRSEPVTVGSPVVACSDMTPGSARDAHRVARRATDEPGKWKCCTGLRWVRLAQRVRGLGFVLTFCFLADAHLIDGEDDLQS